MTPRTSHEQRGFARKLRREMTNAETLLWRGLRGRELGAKFRRQLPIGPYVADFACIEKRLIIELDGEPHHAACRQANDENRDAWLAQQGWRVIRFSNGAVLSGSELVLQTIKEGLT